MNITACNTLELHASRFKMVSFDVFDTVITRVTADPVGVFHLLQRKMATFGGSLPSLFVEGFVQFRIDAERAARVANGSEEVTFREIYSELQRRHALEADVCDRLMTLEIETELESTRPVPANLRLVQELRRQGKRVIFVSDMYLPGGVIQSLLQRAGVQASQSEIYVSCDHGLTKATGNLYREVLQREGCHPSHVFHIGDNPHSDCRMARQVGGVSAEQFTDGGFTRFEEILRQAPAGSEVLSWQLLAGASRLARLQSPHSEERCRLLHEIGANVTGPVFYGFVSWVLDQAAASGIRRLYFLAREGQLLFEIARRLLRVRGEEIELRYLYTSRQAWSLPALEELGERELSWILDKNPFATLAMIGRRVNIPGEDLQQMLRSEGLPFEALDAELSDDELRRLRRHLANGGGVAAAMLEQGRLAREAATAYLRQEGVLDGDVVAVVDSGWFGRSQDYLSELMRLAGCHGRLCGFYFGVVDPQGGEKGKQGYLFSPSLPEKYSTAGCQLVPVLEMMLAADHGSTISYRVDEAGSVVPVLDSRHENQGLMNYWSAHRQGTYDFIAALNGTSPGFEIDAYRDRALALLFEFFLRPTRAQAVAFGDLEFTADQTEKQFRRFAPALTVIDAVRYMKKAGGNERFAVTFWLFGSMVRSGLAVRTLLAVAGQVYRVTVVGAAKLGKWAAARSQGR